MNISIEHSAKGSQRPNHKYVSRKLVNGKWQYYYKYSKVGQRKRDIDRYKEEVSENTKKSKLSAVSAQGHIDRIKNVDRPAGTKVQKDLNKATRRSVKSKYYNNKAKKAKKNLNIAEAALYAEARNDARKVMSDPRYKRQLAKNAAKALKQNPTYKAKRRVETAKTKALKRLALKNKIKYTINKGKRKVKKLIKAIKRK